MNICYVYQYGSRKKKREREKSRSKKTKQAEELQKKTWPLKTEANLN